MLSIKKEIPEIEGANPARLSDEILQSERPLVLKGLVSGWPLVEAATRGADAADEYLRRFYNGTSVAESFAPAEINGRIFYGPGLAGFNFEMRRTQLDAFLDELKRHRDDEKPPVHYVI